MNDVPSAQGAAGPGAPRRRDVLRIAGVGLVAPGLLWGCGGGSDAPSAASYPATMADSRLLIRQAMAANDVPSASVALVDGERVAWREAFGLIDKAKQVAPTPDTRFGIGSVSKVLAALATMILVERRLVDLDAPLVRYLPDFRMASSEYTRITVRMLLSHSSGFPGTQAQGLFTFAPFAAYAMQAQRTLAASRLSHAPGEFAVYCNDGFTMIEPLVAARTGSSYAQFVHDEILAPLGMARSAYPLAPFEEGSYAPGYAGGARLPQEYTNAHASGGLYSTPSDMGRLAMMFMNGGTLAGRRIVSAASIAEMARDQTASLPLNPVPVPGFGLGWDSVAEAGLAAAGVAAWRKNGGTTVYGSEFFVAPQERLAVFVTGTSPGWRPTGLAQFIMLRALAERGSIARVPAPLPAVPLPERTPADAELAAVAGCYAYSQEILRLQPQPDRTLTLSVDDGGAWKTRSAGLKLRDDGTYSSDDQPEIAFRVVTADGRRYLAQRRAPGWGHYRVEQPLAQGVAPAAPLRPAWRARLGQEWGAANGLPEDAAPQYVVRLYAIAELAGYVVTTGGQMVDPAASDTVAAMMLKIPLSGSRDLNDVVVEVRGGEEWLRLGSALFRPLATVPALAAGRHTVSIGGEGLVEWRALPLRGTVSVAGATRWVLLADGAVAASGTDAGTTALPGAGRAVHVLVHGVPGAAIGITVG